MLIKNLNFVSRIKLNTTEIIYNNDTIKIYGHLKSSSTLWKVEFIYGVEINQ